MLSPSLEAAPAAAGPRLIEVFAGSGNLTATAKRFGIPAVGFDYERSPHAPRTMLRRIDLLTPEGEAALFSVLELPSVEHVHIAPERGTSSRAREKPGGPPPLRSEKHLEGLPDIDAKFVEKVERANRIYQLTARIARFCSARGITWSIENPRRSWFWWTC